MRWSGLFERRVLSDPRGINPPQPAGGEPLDAIHEDRPIDAHPVERTEHIGAESRGKGEGRAEVDAGGG